MIISALSSVPLTAADKPSGVIRCSGEFQIDGNNVSSSATLFVGSHIESSNGMCTVRRSDGASIRLDKQTGIDIGDSGVTLRYGTIHVQGNQTLKVAGASGSIRPTGSQSVMNARLSNNLFSINVARGNAVLTGPQSELYAHLGQGTLVLFSVTAQEPSGFYLWTNGCLSHDGGQWSVHDQYMDRRVEILQDTVKKEKQSVGVWGKMQPLPADSEQLVSRVEIVQEKTDQRKCSTFTQVHDLNGDDFQITPGMVGAMGGVFAAEAAGIAASVAAAGAPGQASTTPSLF